MVSVQRAEAIILRGIKPFAPVRMELPGAFGRILREDLLADRDLPPFDRVAMDGIAVNFFSLEKGRRAFLVEGIQKAGSPPLVLKDKNACIESMTGAVLPNGCDCVIPVENIERVGTTVRLRENSKVVKGLNVHPQGADYRKGDILVRKGCRLLSPQIAVAASIGKKEVLVSESPRVAVIATGDELVDTDRPVGHYQIRMSNAYALQSALYLQGYTHVERFHIADDRKKLRTRLQGILEKFDVVILSGGVSMGKYDFIPSVLDDLGVHVLFYKVRQRPGKPFWFGKTQKGKPVFALPGNPVSTHICMYRYVLPFLNRVSGLKTDREYFAVLGEEVEIATTLTCFLPVRLTSCPNGRIMGTPVSLNGSGDYASLARSDGFLELRADGRRFPQFSVHRFYPWIF
jgi:molybdopterin molybdotransferase